MAHTSASCREVLAGLEVSVAGDEDLQGGASPRDGGATRFASAVDALLDESERVADQGEVCAVLAAGVAGEVPREQVTSCLEKALKNAAAPRHQSVFTASLLRLLAHPEARRGWHHVSVAVTRFAAILSEASRRGFSSRRGDPGSADA